MACVVFYLDDGSSHVVTLDDEEEVVTIGRHPDSLVTLTNASVSSHHATIKKREKGFYVNDLGSSNGTRVNGAEVEEALLNDGDRVAFGDVQAVFYNGEPPAAEKPKTAGAPPPKVVFVPRPDAPSQAEARPAVGVPASSPQRGRFPVGRPVRNLPSGYPDQSGGGCATALFLTILFALAFFIGLALRHLKETERGLPGDLLERVTRGMPKVKIEQ